MERRETEKVLKAARWPSFPSTHALELCGSGWVVDMCPVHPWNSPLSALNQAPLSHCLLWTKHTDPLEGTSSAHSSVLSANNVVMMLRLGNGFALKHQLLSIRWKEHLSSGISYSIDWPAVSLPQFSQCLVPPIVHSTSVWSGSAATPTAWLRFLEARSETGK